MNVYIEPVCRCCKSFQKEDNYCKELKKFKRSNDVCPFFRRDRFAEFR